MADLDDSSSQRLDPYKQRVYGSTADQRQGLDPNYRPGYGHGSPRNTIGPSMTPDSDWRAMFHAQNGGQRPALSQAPIGSAPRLNVYSGGGVMSQPAPWINGGVGNGQIAIDPRFVPNGGSNVASVRTLPISAPSYVGDENGDQSISAQIRRQKGNGFGDDQGSMDRVNAYA